MSNETKLVHSGARKPTRKGIGRKVMLTLHCNCGEEKPMRLLRQWKNLAKVKCIFCGFEYGFSFSKKVWN